MELHNVVIVGASGKMGREVIKGIKKEEDIKICGAIDINNLGKDIGELVNSKPLGVEVTDDLANVLENMEQPGVVVDFTHKDAARKNIIMALEKGAHVVVGTTGFTRADLEQFDQLAQQKRVGAFLAPNFSLGAVLMMKCARDLAKYYSQAEIIEYHNDKKLDSPSGTAIATAQGMSNHSNNGCRSNGALTENGCRGAEYAGIRIHSVRLNSLVAHQEVLFSGHGELVTIRHDSFSRESFIPGILLAIRKVASWQGLKTGLESILD